HRVLRLALRPLAAEPARTLAMMLCGGRAQADQLVAEICAEAEGSPFLIAELARHVGGEFSTDGKPFPSSASLADAINERVRRLSPASRRLLEIVSAAGQPLDRSFALAAAGVGRPIIGTLSRACLLRPTSLQGEAAVEVYHDRIGE